MSRRCGRCNYPQSRPTLHARHRALCDRCVRLLGVTLRDEVRAGVDFYLDADPGGPVVAGIVELLRTSNLLKASVLTYTEARRRCLQ